MTNLIHPNHHSYTYFTPLSIGVINHNNDKSVNFFFNYTICRMHIRQVRCFLQLSYLLSLILCCHLKAWESSQNFEQKFSEKSAEYFCSYIILYSLLLIFFPDKKQQMKCRMFHPYNSLGCILFCISFNLFEYIVQYLTPF